MDYYGIALGCIKLSTEDFDQMTPEEFAAVYNAYVTQRDFDYKDNWERMRMQSYIYASLHMKKGKTITPKQLMPLPWDKENIHKDTRTAAEQRARTEELMRRAGYINTQE